MILKLSHAIDCEFFKCFYYYFNLKANGKCIFWWARVLFLKVNLKMNKQQNYIAAECTEPLECDPFYFFVDLHKLID